MGAFSARATTAPRRALTMRRFPTRENRRLAYDLLEADSGNLVSHHEFEVNKYPFMVHAEINALHYARGKVPPGSKLYVIGFPCERCAQEIALSGVAEVFVTKDDYDANSMLNDSRDTAFYMFAQAVNHRHALRKALEARHLDGNERLDFARSTKKASQARSLFVWNIGLFERDQFDAAVRFATGTLLVVRDGTAGTIADRSDGIPRCLS